MPVFWHSPAATTISGSGTGQYLCPLALVTETRKLGSRLIDSVPDPLTLVSLVTVFQDVAKGVWQESTEVFNLGRAPIFKAEDIL